MEACFRPLRRHSPSGRQRRTFAMKKIVILFERGGRYGEHPDERLVNLLEGALTEGGYSVYVDRHLKISVDWARSVDEKIRRADAIVVVLSGSSEGGPAILGS